MLNNRKIKSVFLLVFVAGIFLATYSFCEEDRSPFQDYFPSKVEQPVEEAPAEPVVEYKETFDTSAYKINGLIWGTYKPKAIINGEIYGVGDMLDSAEITKIDKEGITLIFNNEEYVIAPERKIDFKIEGEK